MCLRGAAGAGWCWLLLGGWPSPSPRYHRLDHDQHGYGTSIARAHRTSTSIIGLVSRRDHQATGAGFSLSACAISEITRAISSVPLSGVTSMYRTPAFRSASFLIASRAAAVPW